MSGRLIIGLTGLAGSGKSTAADHLMRQFGRAQRVGFATPLKDMMRALGLGDRELYGDRKEATCDLLGGKTPRHAMQTLGTEWGRGCIDSELWVNAWRRRCDNGMTTVTDDLRFDNEARAVHDLGGVVWLVERPGTKQMGHVSESGVSLLSVDFVLHNDHDVAHLTRQIDAEIRRIKGE